MKKNFSLILIGLFVFSILAACVPIAAPANPEAIRSMNVSGVGRVMVVPDIATINVGVRTESDNVQDALDGNTTQANAISKILQDLGIAKADIQTSNFNVYPSDRYDPMTGQIEGRFFVVENTVNVTVRELGSLGDVLSAVVEAGANNIYGINFNVEDSSAAIAEARALAIQDAQAKAETIAAEAGVELGELLTITVSGDSGVTPYFDGMGGVYMEATTVPVAAGTLTITLQASLTYAIK